jgi:hypothetical protein
MTKIKDLIATLQTRNPEAQVFMMTTRKQPFENYVAGIVGRDEMADQQWRLEPGIAPDDIFLVVGKRIRPGSLSAWIIAEHRAATRQHPVVESPPSDDAELMAAMLADIVREHLDIDSLEDRGVGVHCLPAGRLRRALEAAYRAGGTARERASDGDAAQPLATIDASQAQVE